MVTSLEISKLIPSQSTWQTRPGGFIVHVSNIAPTFKEHRFVNEEDLASIDRKLPSAIRLLASGSQHATGFEILDMLKMWDKNIFFESSSGNIIGLHFVGNIQVESIDVIITGHGFVCTGYKHHDSGDDLMLPVDTVMGKIQISKKWLTDTHPGWEDRYLVASTLELDPNEIMYSILGSPNVMISSAIPSDF